MAEATHAISTGAVARRLGVSPTTVRSWDQRYGIGPAVRADGKHRRWAPGDIAMLEEMCRLTAAGVPPGEAARAARATRGGPGAAAPKGPGNRPESPVASQTPQAPQTAQTRQTPLVQETPQAPQERQTPQASQAPQMREAPPTPAPPSPLPSPSPSPRGRQPGSGNGLPLGSVTPECRGLARAAVRLDGPAMESLLERVVRDYGLVAAWEQVMAPALHAVGRKWASSGDRYVEVEHLLSWHVSTALRRRAVASPGPFDATNPVVLACVPAEAHTLPLEALAAGLAERGLPYRMFGGAVPAEALIAVVRRSGPAAVVLWSQARSTAAHALATSVADTASGVRGARTTPLVVLAGPGWAGRGPGVGFLRPTGLREALDAILHLYEGLGGSTGRRGRGEDPTRF
ncbi:MerR family transcriptional regulator [Streptomyces zaomyceticus]|uniref:MerR family transcriptional regulator n=1 Tax=Streptomyces zaomyceticus TaxID=68286 RepID=UPI00365B4C06